MKRLSQLAVLTVVWCQVAFAECAIPTPDGNNTAPTRANIFGVVEHIEFPNVTILLDKNHASREISVEGIKEIYSVYGGFEAIGRLRNGMQIWVWFEGCAEPTKGKPRAIFLQFFSLDISDRATLDEEGRIVHIHGH